MKGNISLGISIVLIFLLFLGMWYIATYEPNDEYIITYKVYYPDGAVEYTKHTCGKPNVESYNGSNHIYYKDVKDKQRYSVSTTCPIKVISFKQIK